MNSREQILERIRKAKLNRSNLELELPDLDSAIYKPILPNQKDCFKTEMESVSGYCTLCSSEKEAYQSLSAWIFEQKIETVFCVEETLKQQLSIAQIAHTDAESAFEGMQAAITSCEFLVARTGSVVVSSLGESGRRLNFYPPIHIVIANAKQLVDYPEDAIKAMKEKYGLNLPSMISLISGPSRTADIEKTLVLGAHGPKVLHVFIYE